MLEVIVDEGAARVILWLYLQDAWLASMSSASAASFASASKVLSLQTPRKRGTSAASWYTCCARFRSRYAPAEAAVDSTLRQ